MIADFNTMPLTFSDCNIKYFNHSLPTPGFGLINKLHTLAKFEYLVNKGPNKKRKPLEYKKILFTDCYDFDEKVFVDIMVHEMIHYYIAWNGIKDNGEHGLKFMEMANRLNEAYGLNVTRTFDSSSFVKTANAPKSLFQILFG